jgi:diaminopimelate decarboxylase
VIQTVGEGELVAFMSAGAYGYTMASRYNTRTMPAEVLVSGSRFELVNARENFDAMVAGEKIPAFLKT